MSLFFVMELLNLLFLLTIWIGIAWILSSFFEDRQIKRTTVFWLSVFLTPIIGILIGLSSERKPVKQNQNNFPNNSYDRKDKLLSKIIRFKKEEELGIISEKGKKELESLIIEYQNIDQIEEEAKQQRELKNQTKLTRIEELYLQKKELKREFIKDMKIFTRFVIGVLLLLLLFIVGVS